MSAIVVDEGLIGGLRIGQNFFVIVPRLCLCSARDTNLGIGIMATETVGFIGIGTMGQPMARCLGAAG